MIIMALDHVRDFFNEGTLYVDPANMETTTPILFFTRWITHFCAPTFVFLAGTAAFMYGQKVRNKTQLSRFLLTRGLWLIFVEVVIINFAWTFDISFSFAFLQVIWAIGCCMIFLSGIIWLPVWLGIGVSFLMVFGHNLLDGFTMEGMSAGAIAWYILHQFSFLVLNDGQRLLFFAYPLVPWIGVMALGYYMGNWFKSDYPAEQRVKNLVRWGLGLCALFLVFRIFNIYGDPNPWETQRSAIYTFLDFWNTSKYPPSLLFLCMTLGPTLLLLAWVDNKSFSRSNPMIVFGKVPFFYYVIHFYFIHLFAFFLYGVNGHPVSDMILSATSFMDGHLGEMGFPLWVTYLIWMGLVVFLYFPCRWYANLKARRKDLVILSYL